ncbi:sugar phosphate nucleotidyltransferase [Paenibacillus alvei]|uniref:Sugar phosphate nucleotidyltransferase n=1 Tax=Paenibacillus alvei TaxID=44250 RepID=A0ABT4H4B7_PAEAL|nr:sugar phosphate nucleotidyltransferase [Paenibacillus alvei]MCY9763830.1 sugar phosphate nucleotidyltransferase [Paenibacillus alvei]MCY9765312.1 sugar phosphate nucleotidyltransferase [Paenibacillus alvei]
MKAVIMAGGKGTRLRPLTLGTPKPMVPLLNRPCMEYIIELLKRYDIHQIAVTVQYLPEIIRNHFGDGSKYGVQLHYFEEDIPLGTAGSIKNAETFLNETFVVISGDALTDFNLRQAIHYHKEKQALATIVLTQVSLPLEYGVVMTDEEGRVSRFLEKPSYGEIFSDTVNTGIYVLEPEILNWIPERESYDFSLQLFPRLLEQQQRLYGYTASGYWSDIGNLQQYRQTQFDMLDRRVDLHIQAAEPMPGLFVEHGVRLPSRIRLSGPAYIGSDSILHPSCSIGPYTILGSGNIVFPKSSVTRSILWNGNRIAKHCDIEDAILLHRTVIGSDVHIQEGAVVGSGCTIGDKSHIRSQVKLWPNKEIEAHSIVNSTLIWGNAAAALFKGSKICGSPNRELTPEFIGKLACAYGSILNHEASIVLASSSHPFDNIMKAACAAGLQSQGIHMIDIGDAPLDCLRHAVTALKADGAIHFKVLSANEEAKFEQMVISWMDARGMPFAKGTERKIENAYFQEDFARTPIEYLGRKRSEEHAIPSYFKTLSKAIDFELIQSASFKIVIQSSTADAAFIQKWSSLTGGVLLHTQSDVPSSSALIEHIRNVQADIGILLTEDEGFSIYMNDGTGMPQNHLLPLILQSLVHTGTNASVGVPISAPVTAEQIVNRSGIRVVRTQEPLRSQMEATSGIALSPAAHRLYAISLILQLMADTGQPLHRLIADMPTLHTAVEEVTCPRFDKGSVMREMTEWVRQSAYRAEFLDGIKIETPEGSILIQPDQEEPLFRVISQAESMTKARILAHEFAGRLIKSQPPLRK